MESWEQMMRITRIVVFVLLCGAPLRPQGNPLGQSEMERRQWLDHYLLQRWEDWQNPQSKEEEAQRREERLRQWRFTNLMQRFMVRWNELAQEYNSRGGVDPKKFKATSKAFHDLEKSEGWLAPK
jgi:coproporphyrinogen III oxidase-like Fe-S oxidoreductase